MKESRFRKLNEIEDGDFVLAGAYYYTEKKNASAELPFHTVKAGETLWSISQKYGILLSSLKSKNRIRKDAELKPGMILNLQEPRKRGEKIKTVATQAQVQTPKNNESSSPEVNTPPAPTAQPKPELKNQETPKSTQVTHTVNQGETLFAISRKYGVTIDQLKSWNGIGRDNIISIGQKLTIFKP
jgi:membrane-bound lytic murein transglycosylase D